MGERGAAKRPLQFSLPGEVFCSRVRTEDTTDRPHAVRQLRHADRKGRRANEPATALDRAHVFMMKLLRTVCTKHGIEVTRDKTMHSLMGEYVKRMRQAGHLESVMTERIFKTSISTFEAFNDVRNNQSLAHDNAILNHDEAVLIFAHVAASIRFINALENRIKPGDA